MSSLNVTAIVLAGGQGKRMHSDLPKVLHRAAGRTLLSHVVHSIKAAGIPKVRVVVGYRGDEVKKSISDVEFYLQEKQLGTADAVRSADVNSLEGTVLICNGDMPLVSDRDIRTLLEFFNSRKCDLVVAGAIVKNPKGLGRLVHSGETLHKIVEERDASPSELKICAINVGTYVVSVESLKKFLPMISNKNRQNEFYLTDLVDLMMKNEKVVKTCLDLPARASRGVNDQFELARVRKNVFLKKAKALCLEGVVIEDPWNTYIDVDCEIGKGTTIGPGVVIKGKTTIGENCSIEGHCQITNAVIADQVHIKWGTIIEDSRVGANARVGPYARLRPESNVAEECHIGNFVELKKATLHKGVKANHLAYLGDVEVGERTNIGCGAITVNYAVDKKKYKTTIGKDVFIGSDSQLVAPITVGDNAVVGSGSTITKDVPEKALAVARARQFVKENYNKG